MNENEATRENSHKEKLIDCRESSLKEADPKQEFRPWSHLTDKPNNGSPLKAKSLLHLSLVQILPFFYLTWAFVCLHCEPEQTFSPGKALFIVLFLKSDLCHFGKLEQLTAWTDEREYQVKTGWTQLKEEKSRATATIHLA